MKVKLTKVFILHQRPFRETSMLLDLFSKHYGRVAVLARGVKKAKHKWRGVLQQFSIFLASWNGNSELKTLCAAEPIIAPFFLQKQAFAVGFYLNELLVKFLKPYDAYPVIFDAYENLLREFSEYGVDERSLRLFEKLFLQQIGYGLDFSVKVNENSFSLQEDVCYRFCSENGFVLAMQNLSDKNIFLGSDLISFAEEKLDTAQALKSAKRLIRVIFANLLGVKNLRSRSLFDWSIS